MIRFAILIVVGIAAWVWFHDHSIAYTIGLIEGLFRNLWNDIFSSVQTHIHQAVK
jgi:hypothetical protein